MGEGGEGELGEVSGWTRLVAVGSNEDGETLGGVKALRIIVLRPVKVLKNVEIRSVGELGIKVVRGSEEMKFSGDLRRCGKVRARRIGYAG